MGRAVRPVGREQGEGVAVPEFVQALEQNRVPLLVGRMEARREGDALQRDLRSIQRGRPAAARATKENPVR